MREAFSILLATAVAMQPIKHEPPELLKAQERWRCSWSWEGQADKHLSYIGVYRSHAELFSVFEGIVPEKDEILWRESDHAISQNDDSALVFVYSDMGNTDISGKTRRWATIYLLEKRSGVFKKVNVGIGDKPNEATGHCNRY